MAISYVGGQVAGRAGVASTASITFNLTGGSNTTPQAGDLVVITAVVGSQARNPAQAISGYTALGQLNPTATTYDTSMNVSWKFMGSTPDTTFTLPSTGNIADAQRYTIQVFRGVDPTTPLDVTPVSATGTATGRPNPGSITPVTAGAWVVICGGGAAATGVAYVAPANFTTNFLTGFTADTNDAMVGSGYWSGWTSGAVDPAAYTGGTANAVDSWAAYTIALRPAAANSAPTLVSISAIDSGAGVNLISLPPGWAAGDYLIAVLESSGGETMGIDAGWPGWTQIAVADTGTTGIGSARLTLLGKFASAGETTPDTTSATDHVLTMMAAFRGTHAASPVELSATGFNATASTSVSIGSPGSSAGPDRTLALFVASGLDSAGTTTYRLWNNANVNLVENRDAGTTAGVGGTVGIATGRKAAAGAIGSSGVTQTSAQAVWIALVLQPAGASTYNETLTESLAASDSLATSATFASSRSESVAMADTVAGDIAPTGTVYNETLSESIAAGAAQNSAATFSNARAESISAADSLASSATFLSARAESVALSDTVVGASVNPVRYIRDRMNGSTANGAAYWCGIQAFDGSGVNKALASNSATVIANFAITEGATANLIDGSIDTGSYLSTGDPYAAVIIDLGATYNIASIKSYHYWGDGRTFHDTLIETSVDGVKWTTIWDSYVSGEYAETSAGKEAFTLPEAGETYTALGTIIPLYSSVAGVWTTYQGTADEIPSIAIFNPSSGPGAAYDSAYGAKVDAFRAAGGKVIGYVSTSYAGTVNTARTTTAVNADVLKYHQWYNIDGIFFDEWKPESDATAYASTIYSYMKGLKSTYLAVGNAGPKLAEVYLSTPYLDTAVIYEETAAKHTNWTMPPWAKNYSRNRFAVMVHAASSAQMQVIAGRARYENVGYVFATDDVMANPWDVAPTYWTTEATALAGPWNQESISLGDFYEATVTNGPVTYNETINEALALSDSRSTTAIFSSPVAESVLSSDALVALATFQNTRLESFGAADSLASSATFNNTRLESVSAGAAQSSAATFNNTRAESVSAAASTSVQSVFNSSLSESVATAANQTAAALFSLSLSEGLALSDFITNGSFFEATLNESFTAGATQSAAAVFGNALSEAISAGSAQSVQAVFNSAIAQALSLSDDVVGALVGATYNESIVESFSAIDALSSVMTINATLTESSGLSSVLAASMVIAASVGESITPAAIQQAVATFSIAISEALELGDYEAAGALFTESLHAGGISVSDAYLDLVIQFVDGLTAGEDSMRLSPDSIMRLIEDRKMAVQAQESGMIVSADDVARVEPDSGMSQRPDQEMKP